MKPDRILVLSLMASLVFLLGACGQKQEAATDTMRKVWFGNLNDGQKVTSPFTVEMKAQNLVVEAAVKGLTDGHGHFHILINSPMPQAPSPIPKDSLHIHYGKGDTVTSLDLPVGEYSLTLQFAKGDHVPYDPQIAQTIRIQVTGRTP
jgi:hypothetical protein